MGGSKDVINAVPASSSPVESPIWFLRRSIGLVLVPMCCIVGLLVRSRRDCSLSPNSECICICKVNHQFTSDTCGFIGRPRVNALPVVDMPEEPFCFRFPKVYWYYYDSAKLSIPESDNISSILISNLFQQLLILRTVDFFLFRSLISQKWCFQKLSPPLALLCGSRRASTQQPWDHPTREAQADHQTAHPSVQEICPWFQGRK